MVFLRTLEEIERIPLAELQTIRPMTLRGSCLVEVDAQPIDGWCWCWWAAKSSVLLESGIGNGNSATCCESTYTVDPGDEIWGNGTWTGSPGQFIRRHDPPATSRRGPQLARQPGSGKEFGGNGRLRSQPQSPDDALRHWDFWYLSTVARAAEAEDASLRKRTPTRRAYYGPTTPWASRTRLTSAQHTLLNRQPASRLMWR